MSRQPRLPSALPRLFWLGLLASSLATGCDDGGAFSNLRPRLVLSPDADTPLEFGVVVLTRNDGDSKTILVTNAGDGLLVVEGVEIEGPGAAGFSVLAKPRSVGPGASSEVIVRFDPRAPSENGATLVMKSNDPARPEVRWPLNGIAREPCVLYADQSKLYFNVGDVKTVNLTSLTKSECVVERISLDRRVFPIRDEPALPLVVPSGGNVAINLEHQPASTRQRGAPVRQLTFYEKDGAELSVLLEGEQPLFGCLSAAPLEIVFPQTELGQTRRTQVTVSNNCGKAASITSVVVGLGWETYSVDAMDFPVVVPPQGEVAIWISYSPASPITDFGTVNINTNDSANPRFTVTLNGNAAVPELAYFPTALDFGTVIYRDLTGMAPRSECSSAVRIVKLYSNGSSPLRINQLEVDSTRDGYFEITGVTVENTPIPNFNLPFLVPVGSAAEVTMQFFPVRATPAEHLGRLLIHHNASVQPSEVELRGLAAGDGPVNESFTQLAGPKADILWVIDNSCSMFDEQARLINNMSRFVTHADSINSDYQMAVTVTDSRSPEAGKFRQCWPHPRIIRHDYPDREEAFRCTFEVGTNGPFLEAGLGAARQALLRAQDTSGDPLNPNQGFLRDDANLAIVVLSDEEDQSLESDDLLRDYFWSIKGPGRVKVHAIAGPVAEPCPRDPRIDPGYRYFNMATQTGGTFFNICLEDWSPVLEGLGLDIFTPIDQWLLSQAAVPASITVLVDGRPVLWNPATGFTYDASTNVIQFHGGAVPGPGQQIDVTYLGNCRP